MIHIVILEAEKTPDALSVLSVVAKVALDNDVTIDMSSDHEEKYKVPERPGVVSLFYRRDELRAMFRGVPTEEQLIRVIKTIK